MGGQRWWVPALLAAVLALMLPGGGRRQCDGAAYEFSVKGHDFAAALAYVHFWSLPTLFAGYTIYSSSYKAKSQYIVSFSAKRPAFADAELTFALLRPV